EHSLSAQDEEVMHVVLEAPAQLARFGMSWSEFWNPIAKPLKSRLEHWNHHSLIRRLEAFNAVQLAEADLKDAEDAAKKSEQAEGKKVRDARRTKRGATDDLKKKLAVEQLGLAERHEKDTKQNNEKKISNKENVVQERQIDYLVTLITNVRDELNDLDD